MMLDERGYGFVIERRREGGYPQKIKSGGDFRGDSWRIKCFKNGKARGLKGKGKWGEYLGKGAKAVNQNANLELSRRSS